MFLLCGKAFVRGGMEGWFWRLGVEVVFEELGTHFDHL